MSTARELYQSESHQQRKDHLILEHLDYVRQLLGKLIVELPDHVDRENLESAGVLGLVEAAGQFDPARGVHFRTFAYARIRGAILDELRRNSPISQRVMKHISTMRKFCETMQPPIDIEVISEKTGLSVEEIEVAIEAMRLSRVQTWGDDVSFYSGIPDRNGVSPSAGVSNQEMKELLAEAIVQLPEKERLVVTLYHLEDLRLKEIGEVIDLSESRVSRILSKAEFRLGQYMRAAVN